MTNGVQSAPRTLVFVGEIFTHYHWNDCHRIPEHRNGPLGRLR